MIVEKKSGQWSVRAFCSNKNCSMMIKEIIFVPVLLKHKKKLNRELRVEAKRKLKRSLINAGWEKFMVRAPEKNRHKWDEETRWYCKRCKSSQSSSKTVSNNKPYPVTIIYKKESDTNGETK